MVQIQNFMRFDSDEAGVLGLYGDTGLVVRLKSIWV